MGNRAVIVNEKVMTDGVGKCVYLHWNGGIDSVKPLLDFCKEYTDDNFSIEILYKIAKVVFSSAYLEDYEKADVDNGDNGTYLINDNYEIIKRLYMTGKEQEYYKYDLMFEEIKKNYLEYVKYYEMLQNLRYVAKLSKEINEVVKE